MTRTTLTDLDEVQLLDTTLRDGEQMPGVSLTPGEKVDVARELDAAGVHLIEAGSACTSEGEREAIRRVADEGLDATVTSFARGVKRDVDHALDCGVDGVNLVVPASDKHVETKVGSTRDEVVETTVELVEYAKDHGLWVEVLGEDGSRADLDYLDRLLGAGLDAGADRICYCDTVGAADPERTAAVVSRLAALGPTSLHTHDDLGFGLANVHAGLKAGADTVHGTVLGVGERAGNAALEEVAIALGESYGVDTVELDRLYRLCRTVSEATGVALPPNKAVCGANAFAHESGIHTDGTLKDGTMYEPYPPETVGRERRLVLGKHAGRAGVKAALAEHDVAVDDDELREVVARVKELGERGKRVTDADLLAVADDVRGRERERHVELVDLSATSGGNLPTASVRLRVGDEERVAAGTGAGPVDAGLEAVRAALAGDEGGRGGGDGERESGSAEREAGSDGVAFDLDSYHVDAITGGTDAVVTVEVDLSRGDRSVSVSASDADITRASVVGMVDGLDRLLAAEADAADAEPGAVADD
ncbi:2-isopropylmalate synthase [Halorubrum sp. SP3]|uniref:alpha-isopropylmalate synthase regulatory domain-containing protein n=1 Tax=Halorubrum sp. SP3 TaxID=1537265 RepID=UPI0010F77211|nr:alpha-isopropylmalate synthase regulatory domain-containing protein [Halorubrum sp. SP3]TKX53501.1 2-isopropylmalate synthase [Halorubrum sp. SP3]